MSSLVWWLAQQVTRQVVATAAANPAETSLGFVLIANPQTRGFTLDVLRAVTYRSIQFSARVSIDIARAAAARSSTAATIGRWSRNIGAFIRRHPVGAVATTYAALGATSIVLAQDEDRLTEQVQVRATSQSIAGTGQPGLGSYSGFGF